MGSEIGLGCKRSSRITYSKPSDHEQGHLPLHQVEAPSNLTLNTSRDGAGTISQDSLVHLKVHSELLARFFTGGNFW